MTFRSCEILELAEESENDYGIEIETGHAKLGILMSEDEAKALGNALLHTVESGDMESWDGKDVSDIIDEESN